jgi:hypothetical protein
LALGAGNPVDAWPHAIAGAAAKIQNHIQPFIFLLLDFPLLATCLSTPLRPAAQQAPCTPAAFPLLPSPHCSLDLSVL